MILALASVFTPLVVIMAFVIGVKMAEGRDTKVISRLQMKNLSLEDQLREAVFIIKCYEDAVAANPRSEQYVIQETV
jgi:hypothetical protein